VNWNVPPAFSVVAEALVIFGGLTAETANKFEFKAKYSATNKVIIAKEIRIDNVLFDFILIKSILLSMNNFLWSSLSGIIPFFSIFVKNF
jgi:hypothetical protein